MVTKTGTAGNDVLVGTGVADTLNGLGGNDQLTGLAGADVLDGGIGFDLARYDGSAAGVSVNLLAHTAAGGDAAGDKLTGVEGLIGSAKNDVLTGDGLGNTLIGLAGGDTLSGNAGNDVLQGGAGADVLVGGAGVDTADYAGSAQAVSVNLLFNTGQGGDAQGDTFREIEGVTGSAFADTIVGGGGDNTLKGLAGNDVLVGLAGDDTLVGGAGADRLQGDNGFDVADYSASAGAINVNLLFNNAAGGDAQGDTYDTVEGVTGSKFADQVIADGNANVLRGGDGDDRLFGLAGNDTLFGGKGVDTLEGNKGIDAFAFTSTDDSRADFAGPDTIADFSRSQGDKINLAAIDADPSDPDNDAFTLVSDIDEVFDKPGQLGFVTSGTETVVIVNTTDSNSGNEMSIRLEGVTDLTASDFVL